MKRKIIDLFSGAGGLTEGFRDESFEIINHIEKNAAASRTLELRDMFYHLKHTSNLGYYNAFKTLRVTHGYKQHQTAYYQIGNYLYSDYWYETY